MMTNLTKFTNSPPDLRSLEERIFFRWNEIKIIILNWSQGVLEVFATAFEIL